MTMWKIGVSFESTEPFETLKERLVDPVSQSLQSIGAGVYSNHLQHQTSRHSDGLPVVEHLLIFEVPDFKQGIHQVRMALEEQMRPEEMRFFNLSDCQPLY